MLVKVNGQEVGLPDGSTIKDAIKSTNAPYEKGSVISIIQGTEDFEKHIDKYKLKTSRGSVIIEMVDKAEAHELIKIWKKNYKQFENRRVRWTSSDEVAIGPITTPMEATHDEFFYEEGEVVLSLSGFSSESTHIILIKDNHSSVYGVPANNRGVFARIAGGKRTVLNLEDRDIIKSVEPVVERKSIIKSAAVTDIETPLEDGNQVFTYVMVKPSGESPQSTEHFFSLSENGKVKVDYESNTFAGFYALEGLKKDPELIGPRKRGTVSIRNHGKGVGRAYIYREDRVSTPSHTVIGTVESGMPLLDIAKNGDEISIKTEPERIMTLSMTQKEAEIYLKERGIEHIREGLQSDDALVVRQEPQYTMDIVNDNKIKTFGIDSDNLIKIKFDEKSPRSVWYFKRVSGLLDAPLGSLKVHFAFPGMKVIMFEGNSKEAKGLVPENIPDKCAYKGEIGITNMSKRHTGIIGVRFEDNDEFGPTGEPFNGTNIIGKIIQGFNSLEKFKEGDVVYVAERKS